MTHLTGRRGDGYGSNKILNVDDLVRSFESVELKALTVQGLPALKQLRLGRWTEAKLRREVRWEWRHLPHVDRHVLENDSVDLGRRVDKHVQLLCVVVDPHCGGRAQFDRAVRLKPWVCQYTCSVKYFLL